MSWVLDPATQVVGVQWGGFKFSISASSLLQWRSPEQTRPQIGAPTVPGPQRSASSVTYTSPSGMA
jgi:hypothetical protein